MAEESRIVHADTSQSLPATASFSADNTLLRIDPLCEQFEDQWRGGEKPQISDFLNLVAGADRVTLFQYLLDLEVDLRANAGESPDAAEYKDRFPDYCGLIADCFAARRDLPATIGKYRVISRLGHGGQGEVFRVVDPSLDRELVVKRLRDQAASAHRERLIQEGKLLAELRHPNLVQLIDLGFENDCPFLVMEYVRGPNLRQFVTQHRLTDAESARLTAKVAHALAVAHARGITHLDVKPDNIVIDGAGEPRLLDFGIAHARHAFSRESKSGEISGTALYMAPEQARGEETGPKSDVFALGAVLYFLLTGAAPFAAKTMRDALQRAEQCEFDRQALGQCKSQSLAKICRMTMDSEPPARPTASDLAGQLERCATAQPWRKFALAGVAAAVLLIACVGIWRIGMPWGDSDSPSVAPTGPTVPQSDPTQPVDLLATVRLSRDAPLVEGLTEGSHWTLEEGVLAGFAPPGGHALLQFAALPTEPRNDEQTQVNNVNGRFEYRLDMEVAADASSTLVAIPIVLPNGQLMLKLQDDRLWLEEYERPKVIEESKYLVALGDNASHTISIDVVGEEQSARIVVRFDKRHVFEWDGLYRLVSDDRRDERSHGLLVGSGAARFSRVDLSSTQLPKAQQHYRDGLAKLSHSAGDQPATAAAIDEFTAAIQQDDAFAAAFRERGLARMQQADFGKALADLSETLKLTPRDATAWLIRGRIHAAQGDLEEALSDFDESIALDPSLAPAHKQRGQVLLRLERWDEAGASLYRWIDLAPHDRGPLEITDAVRAKLPPVDELSWRPASEVDWASSPGVQFLRGQFYPDKIESDPRRLSTVFFGRGAPASLVPDDPEGHVSFHLRKSDAQTVELGLRVEPPPGYQLKAPAGNEKHPPVRIDFTPGNYRLHEVELAKPDVKQDERYNSEVLVAEFEHSAVYVWQIEAERLPTEISGNLAYIMATDMMTRRLTEEFRLPLDGHRLAIRNTTAAPVQVYLNDVWNLPRFRTSLAAYQLAELETYPGQIWTFKQFGREIDFYQATGEPDQQAQAAFSGMPVRIAIGPDGIRSTSGLSADQERQARSFFDQLELPEERLVIYVRRQTTGHLQWEIEGQIDAALEQRIREVLAGLL